MISDRWAELVGAEFVGGYPTPEASRLLRDEVLFQRAVQVYDWALPAVALESMRLACADAFGAGVTTLVRWRRIGPETLAVTSNPDVSYAFSWLDLKADGPTVVDAAAGLQGLLDDAWQRPLTDVGAAGLDRGQGGRFLIVPPGFDGQVPDDYFLVRSATYRVFVFLRGFFDAADPDRGLAQIDQTRIYPLTAVDDPPAMRLVDGAGTAINGLPPADASAFGRLAGILDYEPAEPEHFYLRGMAASLGLVQSQPFTPDPNLRRVLDAGATVGDKIAGVTSFGPPDDLRVWPERRWTSNMVPGPHVVADPQFKTDTYQDVDALLTFFTPPRQLIPGRRERIILATKAGLPHPDAGTNSPLSADGLRASIQASLRRLGVEYIDLFYLHQPDRSAPLAETLNTIAQFVAEGKITALGVSNYAVWQISEINQAADRAGAPRPVIAQ